MARSFMSSKEFRFYSMCDGKLLEAFNQGSEIIGFMSSKELLGQKNCCESHEASADFILGDGIVFPSSFSGGLLFLPLGCPLPPFCSRAAPGELDRVVLMSVCPLPSAGPGTWQHLVNAT